MNVHVVLSLIAIFAQTQPVNGITLKVAIDCKPGPLRQAYATPEQRSRLQVDRCRKLLSMPSHASHVDKILRKMWKRRVASLLRDVGLKKPGPTPAFSRKYRESQLRAIGTILDTSMRKRLKAWVKKTTTCRSVHLDGVPGTRKWRVLQSRLQHHQKQRNIVYVFWRGSKCLKVGRSEIGLDRIKQQKGSAIFQKARRVAVFFPSNGLKRSIPALECALTHIYQLKPAVTPSKRKWRDRCLLCRTKRSVRKKLRRLFPL